MARLTFACMRSQGSETTIDGARSAVLGTRRTGTHMPFAVCSAACGDCSVVRGNPALDVRLGATPRADKGQVDGGGRNGTHQDRRRVVASKGLDVHAHPMIISEENNRLRTHRKNDTPSLLNPIPLYSSMTIPRQSSSLLSQPRTGPTFLNAQCHKSGFVGSPSCETCGAAFETRAHFLLESIGNKLKMGNRIMSPLL
ncbi:hypothetical protein B0H13DRAFT_2302495 [Mycena leptocephala]|nr:hypothetical protein B0H13DRAFT_2302495 [Mycena leptocephala]